MSQGNQVVVPGEAAPSPAPLGTGFAHKERPQRPLTPRAGGISRARCSPLGALSDLPSETPGSAGASRSDPPAAAAAAPRGPRPGSMARGRDETSPPPLGSGTAPAPRRNGGTIALAPSRVYVGRTRLFPAAVGRARGVAGLASRCRGRDEREGQRPAGCKGRLSREGVGRGRKGEAVEARRRHLKVLPPGKEGSRAVGRLLASPAAAGPAQGAGAITSVTRNHPHAFILLTAVNCMKVSQSVLLINLCLFKLFLPKT